MVRIPGVLPPFISKCASQYNGVHFFDIITSKRVARTSNNYNIFAENVLRTTTACTFSPSQHPKVFRLFFTSQWVSRYNGMRFFDVVISKNRPRMEYFDNFNLKMCFVLQRHTLFRDLNFQKRTDLDAICYFLLLNMLRAAMACTFSTS